MISDFFASFSMALICTAPLFIRAIPVRERSGVFQENPEAGKPAPQILPVTGRTNRCGKGALNL